MRRCLQGTSASQIFVAHRCRRDAIGTRARDCGVDKPSGNEAAALSAGCDTSTTASSAASGAGPGAQTVAPSSGSSPTSSSSSSPPAAATVATAPSLPLVTRPKWSFITNPNDRDAINLVHHSNSVVPNNDAKPLLPMWSSSLTSPKLDKLRLSPDSWVNPFLSSGYHSDEDVELFVRWVVERAEAAEQRHGGSDGEGKGCGSVGSGVAATSFLAHTLQHHIRLKPRAGGSCRGVFARRDFSKGDVIAAVPVAIGTRSPSSSTTATTATSPSSSCATEALPSSLLWGLMLNSDTLRHHSTHAQRRGVPSFAKVQELMAIRRSQFDPFPHELFVDQVYAALFLACEKEAGPESPLFPYTRLLPDPAVDDDAIKAQHHDIMEPNSWREYEDHRGSMRAFLFRIRDEWAAQVEAANASAAAASSMPPSSSGGEALVVVPPPPTMASLEWALRTILARQVMIPSLRSSADVVDRLRRVATETDRLNQEEFWMRNVTKIRQFFLRHVFRVLDEERATRANAFDPLTIATLTPIVDMIQHDALGGNVKIAVPEEASAGSESRNADGGDGGGGGRRPTTSEVLIVATQPIRTGQELRRCFSRCYSASYTLYRYGFLAVRDRVLDRECDLLAAGHSHAWIGASRTVERLLDCDGEVRAIAAGPRVFSIASSNGSGDDGGPLSPPPAHVADKSVSATLPSGASSRFATQ